MDPIKPDKTTRSITGQVSDTALPCRALEHAWPLADWEVEERSSNGRLLHMVLNRECAHGCGTTKRQRQTIRINPRGDLVAIVERAAPYLHYADRTYRAQLDPGQPRPGKADYQFEWMARTLRPKPGRLRIVTGGR